MEFDCANKLLRFVTIIETVFKKIQKNMAQSNSIWGAVMWGLGRTYVGLWRTCCSMVRTYVGLWRSQTPFESAAQLNHSVCVPSPKR